MRGYFRTECGGELYTDGEGEMGEFVDGHCGAIAD